MMLSFRSSPRYRRLRNSAIAIGLVFSAVLLYHRFLHDAPSLWYSAVHDRNGHYRRSQSVAFALRQGSVGGVVHQIHAATVWPPLHPLITGLVLAIGGIDYRLAVIPSLAAWVATCWFAFALARRLAPRYQDLAGGVALLLTLASPAHRAYATDIMLESLGAALTLAALHSYVVVRQEGTAWSGRCFALLLLALFLTKYNYWTLLAVGLLLSAVYEFRTPLYQAVEAWWQSRAWHHLLSAQLYQPLTYLFLGALVLACSVRFLGPVAFTVMGQRVEIETLDFPAQLCFVLLLLRILPWWWRCGRQAAARLPVPARQLVHWHLYPLAIWFLWPRRLGIFLWYITFTQHGRSGPLSPWTGNFTYYGQCLTNDYHANLASLVLVLVLIVLGVTGRRRPAGQLPVFIFLASAALLTNYHSANRSRFLHSWLAVGWVVAGVGAARAFDAVNRYGRRRAATPAWIGATLSGLACLQGPALVQPGHSEEGGTQTARPSLLPIADAVCPDLLRSHRPVVISHEPFAWLLDWRLAEYRTPCDRDQRPGVRQLPPEMLSSASPEQLDAWLQESSPDLLLLIDTPITPEGGGCPHSDFAGFHTWLASAGSYVQTSEWRFPAPVHVTAQIWLPTGWGMHSAKHSVAPLLRIRDVQAPDSRLPGTTPP